MSWEHFEHEADIGVRGIGKTMEEAFAEAAIALVAVSIAPEKVQAREVREIQAEAPDVELLLFAFLNEVVYALRRFAFARFAVRIQRAEHGLKLHARGWGEPLDPKRHAPAVEVKAATLTELRVTQRADGTWMAQCVVDV